MKPPLGRSGGVAAGVLALLLAGCGQTSLGYGVVLWSDGGALAAGAVIHVLEESTIEQRYLVRGAAADRGAEPVPVDRWRVRVFPEPEQAAAFAASYAPFAASYGYAARNGLPVRAVASATAGIVYKLREGEVVKVLQRSAQPEQVGAYENYWYHVLTEDGVAGHTFGEFLPVFESSGDPQADAARLQADDPTLDHLLATVWRPEYFRAMVLTGRYDLTRFRAEYGLFPDPAAQVLRLVTAAGKREFAYRAIERVGDGRYVLRLGDAASPVRLTVHSATRMSVSYTAADGHLVTQVLHDLQRDVGELISAERARRDQLYGDLLRRGAVWRSTGYGTIELEAERRYRWHGFQALVPGLLPPGLPGTGRVDFRYAPAPELAGSYDTVITFLFDGAAPPEAAATGEPATGATGAEAGADSGAPPAAGAAAAGIGNSAASTDAAPDQATPEAGAAALQPPPVDPEPAAELTLLAEYDGNGIRLTPADPDRVTLQVTHVGQTPVVIYFSFAAGSGVSAPGDG